MTLHRLTINIPTDLKVAMDGHSESTGATLTELVRRGVRLFLHLYEAQERGATFTIVEKDGTKRGLFLQ
jgi:hypothetical protein